MSYDLEKFTKVKHLKALAERTKTLTDALRTDVDNAIKSAVYSGNTLSLYRTADHSGTAAFSFDLPEEMFLDQAHTSFVGNFAWSSTTYPGSTNPNLDGKPVMVLAIKGDATNPAYSFLDMQALVDTYTAADDSVTVGGYQIGVQIDSTAGNALTLVSGHGLRVDISGKADKVASATNGHLAGLDGNGNMTDSGVAAADVQQKLPANGFTAGNVRTSNASGFAQDGGVALSALLVGEAATDAEITEMLNEALPVAAAANS